MEGFAKIAAAVLVALVACQILSKGNKDFSLLVVMVVCCMVAGAAMVYLEPVMEFLQKLQSLANVDSTMLQPLLKAVGVGILAEVVCLVCQDSGNASLGKAVQLAASAVILYLSVPMMDSLLELVRKVLGEI